MKKLLFIGICLAVTTMLMSCDKNKVLGTDDIGTGWPSSTTLAKYGLNGLQKPSGSTGAYFAEAGGVLAINFGGNSSTATALKSYFSGNGWQKVHENSISGVTTTTYSKISGSTEYSAALVESSMAFSITVGIQ